MDRPLLAHSHEGNGAAISAAEFIARACDPTRSVVVEACAGSGKTWLLVSRMLRLLLAGAAPAELLAITFTRRAAQEMRERLMHLLHELAVRPEQVVRELLRERGVAEADLPDLVPVARSLYEKVLSSSQSLSIDTFHSWFAKLLQAAPLASGVPHAYALAERTGELRRKAHVRFMQWLDRTENAGVRQALLSLYDMLGDWNTKQLLDTFVEKRAEWWAATGESGDTTRPLAWLREICGNDGMIDARLGMWDDHARTGRLRAIANLLSAGGVRNRERSVAIEHALSSMPSHANFKRLLASFWDDKRQPRRNDLRHGGLQRALQEHFGPDGINLFQEEFAALGHELLELDRRGEEACVLALNALMFTVGPAYLAQYQAVKTEQRVLDFTDLEWHVYRLLTNEEHAAYLQSRLDARYRHVLLDEFQDTNPMQWSILRAWFNAYGGDAELPGVFIVGDPKQSIYRFRRAEPRVFYAARDMLAELGADILRTDQTRRNASAIVDALNIAFAGNPLHVPHTTLGLNGGIVWRLPLIRTTLPSKTEDNRQDAPAHPALMQRDPLVDDRQENDDVRRVDEGEAVAAAIRAAMQSVSQRTGHPTRWSDVMVLVRKRTYLSAYESAFRMAGIPFVSDRRGGLLESLEITDLIALLGFMIMPADDRALAHALKSPIFGVSDEGLICLARCDDGAPGHPWHWWARLQKCAETGASPALQRAAALLTQWQLAASRLPVHELLDLIVHQGELVQRYAQVAHPALRSQVVGNIEAFIELALDFNAGRYPSLPGFLDHLRLLQHETEHDAPAEAAVDNAFDAVRILTIHGAKGLEAPIVVLVDANHSEPARDAAGILCDWPLHADAPTHFSCYGRKDERGAARDALFAEQEELRRQEDWNMLYVAATRAKEVLMVSGVAATRGALADGCHDGSWYHRFQFVSQRNNSPVVTVGGEEHAVAKEFILAAISPPSVRPSVPSTRHQARTFHVLSQRPGEEERLLRSLLQRLTETPRWPLQIPAPHHLQGWLDCALDTAIVVHEQAMRILFEPELERFFNPQHFLSARNALEIIDGIECMQCDRVVVFDDEVWLLDYLHDLPGADAVDEIERLIRRCRAAQAIFPGKALESAWIASDGRLLRFERK